MAETGYKPVPHDAAFRKALLAKPGVQKAFDELEEEYTALHAMLEARQAAMAQGPQPCRLEEGYRLFPRP